MPPMNGGYGQIGVPGATDLGLGSMLADQVAGETEEQRKKRMREQQLAKLNAGGPIGASGLMGDYGSGMGSIGPFNFGR